ncbi:MAG TPA: Rne/Rng family ribonuclease [Actinomycetota bacterium]|nr:Rne/Rng family ribonuclease [Actinomycetota bacterium]
MLDSPSPQFQVTTVETTATASFPGGPPPARRPRRTGGSSPSLAGAGQASGAVEAEPTAAEPDSAEAATSARRGRVRSRAGDQPEPAAEPVSAAATSAATSTEAAAAATGAAAPSATGAETATPAAGSPAAPVVPTDQLAAGAAEATAGEPETGAGRGARTGRSRPRSARTPSARRATATEEAAGAAPPAEVAVGTTTEVPPAPADEAVPATPPTSAATVPAGTVEAAGPAAADEPAGDARPGRRRRRRRSAQGRAAGDQPAGEQAGVAAANTAEPATAMPDDDADVLDEQGAAGSARTRARRRRRAAAKSRVKSDEDAPAQTTETNALAEPVAAAGAAPAAPAARPAGRSRGGRQRAAEPTPAGERERPARGRGRGRAAAPAQAEQPPAASAEPPVQAAQDKPAERSTRLDARARGGTRQSDRGRRRRPHGLTEEQKQVLRSGPDKRMLVTEGAERTQIGVLEGSQLVEHYVTRKAGRSYVGNIYLGRVQNVLPGMEAAFVDIGKGRNAVLYAGEVNYDEEDLDGEAPRIEKALKPGQSVLVQVTKDPIGAKGARLTAQVSLAGRYLVLQPDDTTFGISRRLPENERTRLREILKEVRPKGLGLIVRTAAEGASADDLRADLARLQARWETVERKAKKASAPAVIYSEPELVVRVIRDIFSPDFVELVVDGDDLHERVREYLAEVAPDQLSKLRHHEGRLPLFEHYRVVEQIHKALERKVWLPSGGSIVIDRTEAMTVVDVNTGKFVGKSNLEETVVANNLEAADELVRQLRLRDIGGIIIIDFIDMLFERNQQAVVERLRDALARDKTKSQVMEVSSLGLVQMTRKRVSGGLLESFSETCPHCEGRGVVITHEI